MRTIWKGSIKFGLVTIPIRIFNAISPTEGLHFNQIHKNCNGLVGLNRFCKKCNASLKQEDIVRGIEYAPSLFLVINQQDLDSIKLASTRTIVLQGFVSREDVHPSLYDTPYYLGPDGAVAPAAYGVLRDAMKESGKVAIGKVVMREREASVLLSPEAQGILLYELRSPQAFRAVEQVPGLEATERVEDHQVLLARTLIDVLTIPLENIDLTDHYQEALKELIDKKLKGEQLVAIPQEVYPVIDLDSALQKSIEQTTPANAAAIPAETHATTEPQSGRKRRRSRELTKMPKQPERPRINPHEEKKKV